MSNTAPKGSDLLRTGGHSFAAALLAGILATTSFVPVANAAELTATSFTADFSAMAGLKDLAAKVKGKIAVLLPETTTSARYTSFDEPYLKKAFAAAGLKPDERKYILAKPVDVEDWGTLTMTFSDGTKGTVFSGDMIMGGVRNLVEVYTSGGSLFANITPNNHMMSYLTDEEKLKGVYVTEKVDRKTGWQYICL